MGKGSKEVIHLESSEGRESSEDPDDDRSLRICCYAYWIIGFVIGLIFLIVYLVNNSNGNEGSGGYYGGSGGYYAGGRYRGGWGSGGRGGCFSTVSLVWTKNESQSDDFAQLVQVKNLEEGSLVGTLDVSMKSNSGYKFTWTRATDVTIRNGNWKAHTFIFSNGNNLTVTSPHLMIIKRNGMMYFLRADNAQIGDEMIVQKETVQVLDMKLQRIKKKVAVETEDGTIEVNGVFASGLCDYNPDVVNKIVKYETYTKKYTSNHFGSEYRYKCMDRESWKKNYLINNGISL